MKALASLILFSLFVCVAVPLRAQDGSIGDLGSGSTSLAVDNGTLFLNTGSTYFAVPSYGLNDAGTLSLNATDSGSLVLTSTAATVATDSPVLVYQPGMINAVALTTTDSSALALTGIINTVANTNTAIVTGGTLTLSSNLAISSGTNGLTLGGVAVSNPTAYGVTQQLIFPYGGTLTYTPSAGVVGPAITAAALQSNVAAGLNFNLIPALTNFGGMGTTVQLLDGTASVNRTVLTTFSTVPATAASDDVNVSGTITDTYVLELSYSQAAALSSPGGPAAMQLQWLDPNTGLWENAVDGNTGGTPTFVDGAYNPAVDFNLGTYGVDTANQEVWAVVDHNSQFVAETQTVPEPSGWALLFCGLAGLLGLRRFRRQEA